MERMTKIIHSNGTKKIITIFERKPILKTLEIAEHLAKVKRMKVKRIDF